MDLLEADLEALESAMRLFFQTVKRPQHWARVTQRAGIYVDRPAAAILHILMMPPGSQQYRVHDLALRLGIEAPSVTRKTQELEQAGYLRRVPDRQDKRAVSLRITAQGRKVSRNLWSVQREIIAEALQGWQPAERRQFVQLFERFSNDLAMSPAHNT